MDRVLAKRKGIGTEMLDPGGGLDIECLVAQRLQQLSVTFKMGIGSTIAACVVGCKQRIGSQEPHLAEIGSLLQRRQQRAEAEVVAGSSVASNNASGNGLIGFGAGPRGVDVLLAKTPSALARCGFRVEEAIAAFLAGSALLAVLDCIAREMSSGTGGAFNHRMIASNPGRNCVFSSDVHSSSIPQACPIAVQSRRPLRIGGSFR